MEKSYSKSETIRVQISFSLLAHCVVLGKSLKLSEILLLSAAKKKKKKKGAIAIMTFDEVVSIK